LSIVYFIQKLSLALECQVLLRAKYCPLYLPWHANKAQTAHVIFDV